MEKVKFWETVDSIGSNHFESATEDSSTLNNLDNSELIEFEYQFRKYLSELYKWEIADAGLLLCGGMSDDGLIDLGSWIVSLGEDLFETIKNDPDEMSVFYDGATDFRTREIGSKIKRLISSRNLDQHCKPVSFQMNGIQCKDKDDFESKFPNLFAEFMKSHDHWPFVHEGS